MTLPIELVTERLLCRSLTESLIPSFLEYSLRNQAHLQPWEPIRDADFLAEAKFTAWCGKQIESINAKQSLRFIVSFRERPERMIASINYSMITPLPSLACSLGYSMDAECQGRGLMQEALRATNSYVFDSLKLHRIGANYMPRNKASAAVLRALGFAVEGYARDYLRINGAWEDHVLTALVNTRWQAE